MMNIAIAAHEAGLVALAHSLPGGLNALPDCEATLERLEHFSLSAQRNLLREQGAIDRDIWHDTAFIASQMHVAPRHRWLLTRWLVALEACGAIEHLNGAWRDRPDQLLPLAGDLVRDYAALGFPDRLARLHQAMIDQLALLLRDEVSLPSLMFPDGRIIESLAAYQRNPFTAYVNAVCGEWLKQCPARGETLHVLELGGGPGLTAAAALDALRHRSFDYLFTDISPLFTQAMDLPGLRRAVLDINGGFAAQGVPNDTFDAVVAGNVLHNARNIDRTLRSIYAALAPGGWLLFSEAVADNRILLTSMQFLLSPAPGKEIAGSRDDRAMTGEVFLDETRWADRLAAAGFTLRATLPNQTASTLRRGGQILFIAQVAEKHP